MSSNPGPILSNENELAIKQAIRWLSVENLFTQAEEKIGHSLARASRREWSFVQAVTAYRICWKHREVLPDLPDLQEARDVKLQKHMFGNSDFQSAAAGIVYAAKRRSEGMWEQIKQEQEQVMPETAKDLAVVDVSGSEVDIVREPSIVLSEAAKAAAALNDVIKKKSKPVIINGEPYLEFEDWQTLGRFYGYSVRTYGAQEVTLDGVKGFKAVADLLDVNGNVVGGSESFCMRDEPKWKDRPTFQLASMAQTRAGSKALRNKLSWVAVLAGYRPTPAEELDGTETHQSGHHVDTTAKEIPFPGKHAGKGWDDLDAGFLKWVSENTKPDKAEKAKEELARRAKLAKQDAQEQVAPSVHAVNGNSDLFPANQLAGNFTDAEKNEIHELGISFKQMMDDKEAKWPAAQLKALNDMWGNAVDLQGKKAAHRTVKNAYDMRKKSK